MYADGRYHLIAFRINHADAVRLRIHHVDFVFLAVGGKAGWIATHLDCGCRLEGAQINHRNRVALAVGNVGILAIGGTVIGQLVFLEIPPSQTAGTGQGENEEKKLSQAVGLMAVRTPDCGAKVSEVRAWVPMAGTVLPTTGAICRTCFISSSNCSG